MSSKIKNILKEELKKISLSPKELKEIKKSADEFVKKISTADKKIKVEIGGSLAKETLIKKNKQDVDVFVVFENETATTNLEKILKKAKLDFEVVHGSRDYFKVYDNKTDIVFEIIPVVENKNPSEANNVTDVSLKHVKYVKHKLNKNKKLVDEIKLAKAFCHGCDVYGAESYIQGFSGYALECLIIYFGGFEKFLRRIKKTKFIDLEKYFKNGKEAMREINKSKLQSPFVLVDPTYKYRNVVAGLSLETFNKFLECAERFLKSPSVNAFEKENVDDFVFGMKDFAKNKKINFIEVEFETDRQEGDIAGTKMKKFFDFVVSSLERKQQEILMKKFYYLGEGKNAKGFLVLKEKNEIDVRGPSVKMKEAVSRFKKCNKKTFVKKGFVWKKEKVDLEEVFNFLKNFENEIGVCFKVLSDF